MLFQSASVAALAFALLECLTVMHLHQALLPVRYLHPGYGNPQNANKSLPD